MKVGKNVVSMKACVDHDDDELGSKRRVEGSPPTPRSCLVEIVAAGPRFALMVTASLLAYVSYWHLWFCLYVAIPNSSEASR